MWFDVYRGCGDAGDVFCCAGIKGKSCGVCCYVGDERFLIRQGEDEEEEEQKDEVVVVSSFSVH